MSKHLSFGPRPTLAELDELLPLPGPYTPKLFAQTLDDAARVFESNGVPRVLDVVELPSASIPIVPCPLVPKDEVWLMDEQGRIGVLKLQGEQP